MRVLVWVCATVLLFGCSNAAVASADAARAAAPAKPGEAESSSQLTPSAPMLAYAYQFGVETPASRIRDLVAKHEDACNGAGASVCEVTGSNIEQTGGDQVTASLTLKATPAWLTAFRTKLADDLKGAGGKITKTAVTSEDLSVQIVDVAAHLKAQTALRDRLQDALQRRPGKTSDFVDLATEVAKAQGDLDAMQSELAVLQKRVATSNVTIDYGASENIVSGGTWAPLASAVHDFVGTFVTAVAAIVYVVGFLAPFAIVIGLIAWATPRFRRWRASRRPPERKTPAA